MAKNSFISIIIPTYNRANLLPYTLNSIITQSYLHWECLIIDDYSSDGTKAIVENYRLKDTRIKYVLNSRKKGAQGARNTGLEMASGDFIQFFDSDDIMYPALLESLFRQIEITGAYHPTRFSNTYLFYSKGWTGINIDARPGSMKSFNKKRPNDINLEVAIGSEQNMLTYYMFDEPGLNGFSKEISEDRDKNTPYKMIKSLDVQLERLETVLDKYMPIETKINFMSIDVEGLDLDVLKSNNWIKYIPKMILIETSVVSNGLAIGSPIDIFLNEKGYELIAKTYRTSFYKLK